MVLSLSLALVWTLLCSKMYDSPWPQGALVWKIWVQREKETQIASRSGGSRWSPAVEMKDVQSFVCCRAAMIKTPLLWCLYKAHSNQGFGLLRLTPALLTTTSWLFLSISICCLFAVRAENSLGFRELFLSVFVHYKILWGSGPGLMLGAVSSGICTWKIRHLENNYFHVLIIFICIPTSSETLKPKTLFKWKTHDYNYCHNVL